MYLDALEPLRPIFWSLLISLFPKKEADIVCRVSPAGTLCKLLNTVSHPQVPPFVLCHAGAGTQQVHSCLPAALLC